MLFPAAGDLLTMFVALEVLSLPLYILCGLARRRRLLSQEASLKYFLLGAFSSAFFLFGSALLFGYAGSLNLGDIATAITRRRASRRACCCRASRWSPSGCCSRSAPCRSTRGRRTSTRARRPRSPASWRPAPRSRRSARSCGWSTSASAGARWDWQPVIWAVAILTMLVGSILAITQTDVKRMLAYSSIAHAGFILVGVLAFDKAGVSRRAVLPRGVRLQHDRCVRGRHAGPGQRRRGDPPVAVGRAGQASTRWSPAMFALFLLAFAGIPLTSGFTAKFAVFAPAVAHGAVWLAVVGVVSSAIAAFFYVRVIVLMYFSEPTGDATTVAVPERDDDGRADHRRRP